MEKKFGGGIMQAQRTFLRKVSKVAGRVAVTSLGVIPFFASEGILRFDSQINHLNAATSAEIFIGAACIGTVSGYASSKIWRATGRRNKLEGLE